MKKFLRLLQTIFLVILIPWIAIYFIGVFISLELNPLNWWIFSNWIGRIMWLFIVSGYFKFLFDNWDQY